MKKPKIVIWDLETAPSIVTTFSLYPESINHENIIQDSFIICAAWKEYGVKGTEAIWVTKPNDDYRVVKKMRDVLASADVICGQNIKKFDIKKLNARIIYHKLPPLPDLPMLDTLTEVKRVASFMSHRLDYLSSHLCGGGKLPTSKGLWMRALKGDKEAIAEMVKYNRKDVIETEKVLDAIKPYIKYPAHMGVVVGKNRLDSCPKCGSERFRKGSDKIRITAGGFERLQRQCEKCNSYSTFHVPKSK